MIPLRERTTPGPRRRAAASLSLVAACCCAALLAACGGSSGGSSPAATSPSASAAPSASSGGTVPSPVPSPHVTAWPPPAEAVAVVRRFWDMIGEGRLKEAQRTLVAPGSDILTWTTVGIESAHYVRLLPDSIPRRPVDGATVEFGVVIWVEPSVELGAWGETGEHVRFDGVVRMSDGTWKMWSSGTGP